MSDEKFCLKMHFTPLLPSVVTGLLVILLAITTPPSVHGHGCPAFRATEVSQREEVLGNEVVPQSMKDYLRSLDETTVAFGVYDCHREQGGNEVGYTAVCKEDGECRCTALYNFQECQSCELACGSDIQKLSLNSFIANCSNVQSDISDICTVGCDYRTYSCFEGDQKRPDSLSSFASIRRMSIMVVGAILLAGQATMFFFF